MMKYKFLTVLFAYVWFQFLYFSVNLASNSASILREKKKRVKGNKNLDKSPYIWPHQITEMPIHKGLISSHDISYMVIFSNLAFMYLTDTLFAQFKILQLNW